MHHPPVLVGLVVGEGSVRALGVVSRGWGSTLAPVVLVVLGMVRWGGTVVVVTIHAESPRVLMMSRREVQPEETGPSGGGATEQEPVRDQHR